MAACGLFKAIFSWTEKQKLKEKIVDLKIDNKQLKEIIHQQRGELIMMQKLLNKAKRRA